MRITLYPVRSDDRLTLERHGDALTIDGVAYDFAALGEGDLLPREAVSCPCLVSDVERIDGRIHLTLRLPVAASARAAARHPAPVLDPPDGPVALPGHGGAA